MKHIYQTTRDVTTEIRWQNALTGQTAGSSTLEIRAGRFVYRGGKRAFAAHLATLNAEHGAGYAVPEIATTR